MRAIRRDARQRKYRRRRTILLSVATVVAVILIFAGWFQLQANPGGSPGSPVVVGISHNESSGSVVKTLAKNGVVTSGTAYSLYLFFHSMPSPQAGGYQLRQHMSFGAVNQALAAGPNVSQLHVSSGLTLRELANQVGQLPGHSPKAFLAATRSGRVRSPWEAKGSTDLEGLVAPGTYGVAPSESDVTLLRQMVQRFDQQALRLGVTPQDAAKLGITPNQLITVASIVQKEGYLTSNMPQVARVIYNRLARAMPLQMDSTVLYSLGRDGGKVTPAMEQINSPYNTYLNAGLPPTPVSFPSAIALRAAANPPAGSWLYFVVIDKHGDEAFTNNFQQQLANENLARSRGLS